MEFDIDVSGEDILSRNYVICIANKDSVIKGFKVNSDLVSILNARYGQGLYKYPKSKKGKSTFKVRLYCILIYYLFNSLKLRGELSLKICKDFEGRETDIKNNLNYFLGELLNLDVKKRIRFNKLDKDSNAHKYAYLMRKDIKNKMNTYVKITLKDMEKLLKK